MIIQRTFRATIEDAGGGGAFVSVPFDVERVYGKKRVPINALIDGELYRGTLVRMGGTCHMLPVLKEIRQKIGKGVGDEVEVSLEEDRQPRVLEIPEEIRIELEHHPEAARFFHTLSYTHQREYVKWIESAKQEKTRHTRLAKAIEMLCQSKKER